MTQVEDPRSVPIRPAATVMLVRDSDHGEVEVFMLRRTGNASFGAGMYVFPGGRVDDADASADLEHFCRGLSDADASEQLRLDTGGIAYWVAAVRECFEEAGILLATSADGSPPQVRAGDQHAIHDGSLSMPGLCERDELILDLSTTEYVDHWITPLGENRRFDTRFFVAVAPPGQHGRHDDIETVESVWIQPSVALQQMAAGEFRMMPPTVTNLEWLTTFTTAAAVLEAGSARRDVPPILPKLKRGESGEIVGISRPGDDDYDTIDVDDPQLATRSARTIQPGPQGR